MKIGIDISQTIYKGTGVARFTDGLINHILEFDRENEWTFLFYSLRQKINPELEDKIIKRGFQLIKLPFPSSFLSFIGNKIRFFPLDLIVGKLDWFITSDWIEFPTINIRKATIVHDLVFLRYPETVDKKILKTQTQRLKKVKKESKIIFVDTEITAEDLIKLQKVNSKKIVVNYPGLTLSSPKPNEITRTMTKYKLDKKPYLLSVGKIEPRKNLLRLIEAFNKIGNKEIDLVIVGPEGWDVSLKYLSEINKNNVHLLGLVNDAELYSLYINCRAFVFPSLWEGFGYPLVEAMKLQAPILCSKIPPFEEVAQNSALYFDPLDTTRMTESIQAIINSGEIRKKLVENGKMRALFFNWQNYYKKLIKTLYDYRD